MNQATQNNPQLVGNLAGQDQSLADLAKHRLLSLNHLSLMEQNRAILQIATAERWEFWKLAGFYFADGSVLIYSGSAWQSLTPWEAQTRLEAELKKPLEVRLLYGYMGRDGRGKGSIAEARFFFEEDTKCWQLVVEYEAYMDSPLFGFCANRLEELLELELWSLHIDTPQPSQRWRLEHIAAYPDWPLELVSRRG